MLNKMITIAEVWSAMMFLTHLIYTALLFPFICFKFIGLSSDQMFYLMCLMGVTDIVVWYFLFRKVLNVIYARKIFDAISLM